VCLLEKGEHILSYNAKRGYLTNRMSSTRLNPVQPTQKSTKRISESNGVIQLFFIFCTNPHYSSFEKKRLITLVNFFCARTICLHQYKIAACFNWHLKFQLLPLNPKLAKYFLSRKLFQRTYNCILLDKMVTKAHRVSDS